MHVGCFFLRISEPSTVLPTWNFLPPHPRWFWDWGSILCVRAWNWSALESTSRGGGSPMPNKNHGKAPKNLQMKADISVWLYVFVFYAFQFIFFNLKMEFVEKIFWNFPVKWSHFFFGRISFNSTFKGGSFLGGTWNSQKRFAAWWTLRSRRKNTPVRYLTSLETAGKWTWIEDMFRYRK